MTMPAFLKNPQLTGIVRTTDVDTRYAFQRWFPLRSVATDELKTIVALDEQELAPFVNIDAETPHMMDDQLGEYKMDLAFVRFKKKFKESDLRIFHEGAALYADTAPTDLLSQMRLESEAKIRRYIERLSRSVDARFEWMYTGALTGSISITSGPVRLSVTYPGSFIGTSNKKSAAPLWDQSGSNPVNDLTDWIYDVEYTTGVTPDVLIVSRKVLKAMARHQAIRELWSVAGRNPAAAEPDSLAPVGQLAEQQVLGALSLLGIREVIKYDATYTTRTDTAAGTTTRVINRFLTDTDLLLLPSTPLGNTPTSPAKPNGWRTGKFGWSEEKTDPWVVEVGAGMYGFVEFPPENQNKVVQATVAG